MKEKIANLLKAKIPLEKEKIEALIETPPDKNLGDYAFPCFTLAKELKKNPAEISREIAQHLKPTKEIEKITALGPYVNFFINSKWIAESTIKKILKEKNKYGSQKVGKNKKIVIEMSSPNIAKPFGIGHLRSTIIGNAIANICSFLGYATTKINYLGDWGTPFGKVLLGYEKFGSAQKLKENAVKHLYDAYVKISSNDKWEQEARNKFRELEQGNKKALLLWKKFKTVSIKDFNKLYDLLGVKFDVISGESLYNKKMEQVVLELEKKNLLEESEGASIVNLEKYNLGIVLIKKSDGATLYVTRDLAAAIDRYKKYKFHTMVYEVGGEQKLHFKQLFKILELLGYSWAKECRHVDHGLYLDKDGKKFSTRKGKTRFMEDILNETTALAKSEISKREKLSEKEAGKRAHAVAISAILYGDLKNHRSNDMVFDIERFLEFEGNTGPYLLYTYARARSILRKAKYVPTKKYKIPLISEREKELLAKLCAFPNRVNSAHEHLTPSLIANYAYEVSQLFNEFYHAEKVIGSENQQFRLVIVDVFSQVLKNALALLGIQTLEKM